MPIARIVPQQLSAGFDQCIYLLIAQVKAGRDTVHVRQCFGRLECIEAKPDEIRRNGPVRVDKSSAQSAILLFLSPDDLACLAHEP